MTQSSRVRNASRENLKLVDQTYGTDPLEVRSTDHYQAEYVQSFVEKWDALIDWDARAKSEGAFFIDLLRRLGKHKVLDVATGTGFHSVQLLEAGFQVTSADGNATMLSRAFENARARGFILRTLHATGAGSIATYTTSTTRSSVSATPSRTCSRNAIGEGRSPSSTRRCATTAC